MIVVVVRKPAIFFGVSAAKGHVGFAPDDRFDACLFGLAVELDRTEHIAVIGHGYGRLIEGFDLSNKRLDLIGTVKKTELRVKMEMNKRRSHGACTSCRDCR